MLKPKDILQVIIKDVKLIHKNEYFASVLVVIGFCLAMFVVLYFGSAPFLSELKEGDISPKTVYAPYDFTYPTSIDEAKTEKARAEFEATVLPVYDIDVSIQEKAFEGIDRLFATVAVIREDEVAGDEEKKAVLEEVEAEATGLTEKELARYLEMQDPDKAKKISKDALESVFLVGIVDEGAKTALLRAGTETVSVRNIHYKLERTLKTKDLVGTKEAQKIVRETLDRMVPENRGTLSAIHKLVLSKIVPNMYPNDDETAKRRTETRSEVAPIYRRATVKKNELVVEKGQRLTKDTIAKLTQITRIHSIVNRTSYLSGLLMLLVGLVFIAALYLGSFERRIIRNPKTVLLICLNAFLAVLVSLIIVQSQQPLYLIPLASIGMILVLLLNVHTALITSLVLSIYIGFMAGSKLPLMLVLFAGSAVGVYAVRGARRRSQIFLAGFAVAAVNFFSIAGIGFMGNAAKEVILREGAWGVVNGIVSSFIVIGLLPVFEYLFSLITNVTLLELSDLSNPLLKDLTVKAPGTYHHSILVGNLAEEACDAIGANSLLARVGAYYHDVGKMEKAGYFVENEMGAPSKHDKLMPSMSALIITNHTKDGVELAKKHKLNRAIIDFINQHHGTSLIYYFYQRALEKVKSENELKEEEFRYPGPKPQTKETAIVLLADAVEASSRMLSDPTPARIRGLVQKIINNKFIDGQLDECELTLKDLHKISESFVRVLTGVFHSRLEYPEVMSKKERQNALKNKSK